MIDKLLLFMMAVFITAALWVALSIVHPVALPGLPNQNPSLMVDISPVEEKLERRELGEAKYKMIVGYKNSTKKELINPELVFSFSDKWYFNLVPSEVIKFNIMDSRRVSLREIRYSIADIPPQTEVDYEFYIFKLKEVTVDMTVSLVTNRGVEAKTQPITIRIDKSGNLKL